MKKIDIFFAIGSNVIAKLLLNFLSIIPNKTGTVTIKNIFIAMSDIDIEVVKVVSIKIFRDNKTITGIVITHKRLIIAVNEIESATSPLAKEVRIFEVAPPGAAAISITPTANSGDKGHIKTKIKAMRGRMIICEKAPTKKSFGCLTTRLKSFDVKPKPKENIMKAKAKGNITSVIIPINYIYMRFLLFIIKKMFIINKYNNFLF